MNAQENDPERETDERRRHARMQIDSALLISSGGQSWITDMIDISATGMLVQRPPAWQGRAGDTCVLDLLLGEELHIHMEASVARVAEDRLGLAYSRIPEDKQAPLWELLGGYADALEPWTD